MSTEVTETTVADVPHETDTAPEPVAKPERAPLDPITRHVWRLKRPARVALLLPFVGHEVTLERWFGRIAANGDQTYKGTILAIATTTIGSSADLVIIKTVEGNVWAISTAQIAYLALIQPPPQKKARTARTPRIKAETATDAADAKPVRRRRKAQEEVPDDAA